MPRDQKTNQRKDKLFYNFFLVYFTLHIYIYTYIQVQLGRSMYAYIDILSMRCIIKHVLQKLKTALILFNQQANFRQCIFNE